MKRILAIVLALVLALALISGCGQNSEKTENSGNTGNTENAEETTNEVAIKDIEYIKANGKMVIGITDFKPMNYKENGQWTGFDTEFAEAVCEKLGVKAEFVEIEWDNKYNALNSKAIDCIWNGMTISDEVLNNTSCSKAYVKNAQVVVMKKDNLEKYKTAEDMADLSFAVETGSAGAETAEENNFANVTEVGSQTDALLEVESGSSDACIIDLTMANAMTKSEDGSSKSYDDLGIACELTSEEYGIGFRKGSDLTEEVNKYIDELMSNGTLDKLAEKYELTLIK